MRSPQHREAALLLALTLCASCGADTVGAATTSQERTNPSMTPTTSPTAAPAWQGSLVEIDFPDGQGVHETFMLNGEGDYEGLAAVGTVGFGAACPNIRGYIIDGRVPAPPVPNTGR